MRIPRNTARPSGTRPAKWTRAATLAATFALLLASTGCGAMVARGRIIGAQAALAGADRAEAVRHAPYEYTAAILYLEKALEMESSGRFGAAIEFGAQSEKLAEQARQKSIGADAAPGP